MLRGAEWIGGVLVIMTFAGCTCFLAWLPGGDKSAIYSNCMQAIEYTGMNSVDKKTLTQECVANSLNKSGVKDNV